MLALGGVLVRRGVEVDFVGFKRTPLGEGGAANVEGFAPKASAAGRKSGPAEA